jgi:heme-degrading monooxygenase HmoA
MTKKSILIAFILIGLSFTKIYSQNTLTNQIMNEKTVTIVKSKAPWYAFDFLLPKKFREVNPIYEKVKGLEFKAYSINKNNEGKNFGGIYLWDNESAAKNWFTPQWFDEVKKKRGNTPTVAYFTVISEFSALPKTTNYANFHTKSIAVFIHALTKDKASNLFAQKTSFFRAYWLAEQKEENGLILFFDSKVNAKSFIESNKIGNFDWFKIPVMLNNAKN